MGWSSGIKSWQDFEKWFLWLELWERFGGLVFDSLISVVFCSKRVWNLVLVFGFVVLWMGFTLPLKDKAKACGGDKRSIRAWRKKKKRKKGKKRKRKENEKKETCIWMKPNKIMGKIK